ncbi:hypothetical protein V5T82_10465 [Magnetovibrio sp. PR-2]|uniref:hypothetical protein n=1 Tax=Magnetovibrio sp. PR-2 TaxID=3120356 RepID=UPI002FCE3EA7
MNPYAFYAAQLRFAASKTERSDADISHMMDQLQTIADQIDEGASFKVKAASLRAAARALAGVSGFLQKQILPEVIAAGNATGEAQVRWTIDTSMSLMATMMTHAEMTNDQEDLELTLPDAPDIETAKPVH